MALDPEKEAELAEIDSQIQRQRELKHFEQESGLLNKKKKFLEDIFIMISVIKEPDRAREIQSRIENVERQLKEVGKQTLLDSPSRAYTSPSQPPQSPFSSAELFPTIQKLIDENTHVTEMPGQSKPRTISTQKLLPYYKKIGAALFENLAYLDLLSEYWKLNYGPKYSTVKITLIYHFIGSLIDDKQDLTVYFQIDGVHLESHLFHGGVPNLEYPHSVIFTGFAEEFHKEHSNHPFIYNIPPSEAGIAKVVNLDFYILLSLVIERMENGIQPTQDIRLTIKIDQESPLYVAHVPKYLQHPERFHPQFNPKLPDILSDVAHLTTGDVRPLAEKIHKQNPDSSLFIQKYFRRIKESSIFDKKINVLEMMKSTHGFIFLLLQKKERIPTLYLSVSQITEDLIDKRLLDPSLSPPHRTERGNALFQMLFFEFGIYFWVDFITLPLPIHSQIYHDPKLALDVFDETTFKVDSNLADSVAKPSMWTYIMRIDTPPYGFLESPEMFNDAVSKDIITELYDNIPSQFKGKSVYSIASGYSVENILLALEKDLWVRPLQEHEQSRWIAKMLAIKYFAETTNLYYWKNAGKPATKENTSLMKMVHFNRDLGNKMNGKLEHEKKNSFFPDVSLCFRTGIKDLEGESIDQLHLYFCKDPTVEETCSLEVDVRTGHMEEYRMILVNDPYTLDRFLTNRPATELNYKILTYDEFLTIIKILQQEWERGHVPTLFQIYYRLPEYLQKYSLSIENLENLMTRLEVKQISPPRPKPLDLQELFPYNNSFLPYPEWMVIYELNQGLYKEITVNTSDNGSLDNVSEIRIKDNHIVELYIKKYQFDFLPSNLGDLSYLRSLNLCMCANLELPKSLLQLQNLTSLVLLGGNIISLPKDFGKLQNLETLILNYLKLISLPDSIYDLGKLKKFELRSRKLSKDEKLRESIQKFGKAGISKDLERKLPELDRKWLKYLKKRNNCEIIIN